MSEYKDLDIKHFKLTSGDDVIGLIAGVKKDFGVLYLERPVRVEFMGSSLYMSEYMPTSADNMVAFSMGQVVAQCDVTDDVKENYIRFCLGEIDPVEEDEPEQIVVKGNKVYH